MVSGVGGRANALLSAEHSRAQRYALRVKIPHPAERAIRTPDRIHYFLVYKPSDSLPAGWQTVLSKDRFRDTSEIKLPATSAEGTPWVGSRRLTSVSLPPPGQYEVLLTDVLESDADRRLYTCEVQFTPYAARCLTSCCRRARQQLGVAGCYPLWHRNRLSQLARRAHAAQHGVAAVTPPLGCIDSVTLWHCTWSVQRASPRRCRAAERHIRHSARRELNRDCLPMHATSSEAPSPRARGRCPPFHWATRGLVRELAKCGSLALRPLS